MRIRWVENGNEQSRRNCSGIVEIGNQTATSKCHRAINVNRRMKLRLSCINYVSGTFIGRFSLCTVFVEMSKYKFNGRSVAFKNIEKDRVSAG